MDVPRPFPGRKVDAGAFWDAPGPFTLASAKDRRFCDRGSLITDPANGRMVSAQAVARAASGVKCRRREEKKKG